MDHVAGSLHILLVGKEGRIWFDVVCLKLYQFEKITWWCLSILEYVMEYALQSIPEIYHAGKFIKKVMVSRDFFVKPTSKRWAWHQFGRPWNLIHSPPCTTSCRLFVHGVFFGPLGLHLRVWIELGRSPLFRPMKALRLQWSWAFNLVCEVALTSLTMFELETPFFFLSYVSPIH